MPKPDDRQERTSWRWALAETSLIFCLFFLLAGTAPPEVNEVHYLGKAKHYWNPQWCSGDFFLESADAHVVFYWLIGWWTLFLPLSGVAWAGRLLTWALLAWAWRQLSVQLVPGRLYAVLTAGLFAALLDCCHLAGEWLLGGVEAKGFAYVLLLLGLEALVRGRWSRVWLLLGAASACHVLVGGWAVVGAFGVWAVSPGERPALRSMLPALLGGLLLAMPGLVPALALTWGSDAETVREANRVYVLQRLGHHLSFHRILQQPLVLDFEYLGIPARTLSLTHLFFLRHLALLGGWLALLWRLQPREGAGRLHRFVGAACLIAAVGIAIDQLTLANPAAAAPLLRYYWFRMSDVMLPLGAALAAGQLLEHLRQHSSRAAPWWLTAAILVVTLDAADAFLRHRYDPRPAAVQQANPRDHRSGHRFEQWRQACRWIANNTPKDEVLLTPRFQQTFKWYAERGEVASWKDVPQDAAGIVQWNRRIRELYPVAVLMRGLVAHGEPRLEQLGRQYGFRYVVLDRTRSLRRLRFLRVYPPPGNDSTYEVYRLPLADERRSD